MDYKGLNAAVIYTIYQRNLEELESAEVQAVERAPTGPHLLQTLPSLSISLFLFIRLDPMED
jgi:hypothetical protein